jgi:hypothetical protein
LWKLLALARKLRRCYFLPSLTWWSRTDLAAAHAAHLLPIAARVHRVALFFAVLSSVIAFSTKSISQVNISVLGLERQFFL